MRIRRQARMIAQLVTEIFEMLLGQPAFDKCARIHAGRGVTLVVNKIARLAIVGAVKEMVLADFDQRRERSVGGDVPADVVVVLVGSDDHRESIPADVVLNRAARSAGRRDTGLPRLSGIVLM